MTNETPTPLADERPRDPMSDGNIRLTPERREFITRIGMSFSTSSTGTHAIFDLLYEIDHLRADIATAERRLAVLERALVEIEMKQRTPPGEPPVTGPHDKWPHEEYGLNSAYWNCAQIARAALDASKETR